MGFTKVSDFLARRTTMVDTQVRPSDVTKYPIIDAMLTIAREDFVPPALREAAYVGENLELGAQRVLLEPRTFAKMLDVLNIEPHELVLDVGAHLGYSSAVMARLSQAVVALEEDAAVSDTSQELFANAGADNVATQVGSLTEGAADLGPYDVIVIQGGVASLPENLLAQLKDNGRIAAIFMDGALGDVRIGYKQSGRITWRSVFNASAPILPGFEAEMTFDL